jgi:hypothetical protein
MQSLCRLTHEHLTFLVSQFGLLTSGKVELYWTRAINTYPSRLFWGP